MTDDLGEREVTMRVIRITVLLLLLALLIIFPSKPVNARICETETVYWDITGDGKKDTIIFCPTDTDDGYVFETLSIYVNGKKMYTCCGDWGYFYGYSYKTIALKNKAKYIFLNVVGENEDSPGYLLRYKKGKLYHESTLVKSIGKLGFHFNADVRKVKGNKVYFTASSMSIGLAHMNYEAVYQYKNGKLKPAGNKHKVLAYGNDSWNSCSRIIRSGLTLNRTIKIYKDAKGKRYKKKLKPGTRCQITEIYLTDTYCSYYIKGKGWYKVKHNAPAIDLPFDGIYYAG